MLIGSAEFQCSTGLCSYSQEPATSPTISSASLSGNTISFVGSNFPSSADFSAKAFFKSASAQIVSWTSSTASATFTIGVPAAKSTELAAPIIEFFHKTTGVVLVSTSQGVTITNTISLTAADSTLGITSSFAGGLSYTITKDNLFASLKESGNQIQVCGNVCKLDESLSDLTKAVCIVPPLATTHSTQAYRISEPGLITQGVWTGNAQASIPALLDDNWQSEYTSLSKAPWIEVDFPDLQVAVLDSMKVFIKYLPTTKIPFAGNTKL